MSNYEDLRGAAANEEIILDDQGIPSVMVKLPLVYLDELGIGSAHTPHPAFIINDIRRMLPHRPPFLLVDRIFYIDDSF